MLTRNDQSDGLYGFGAGARAANSAQTRKTNHTLSLFAAALSTSIMTIVFTVLPLNTATARPFVDIMGTSADKVGLAAMAAFSLSTALCAVMAFALLSSARGSRRRRHRLSCQRQVD